VQQVPDCGIVSRIRLCHWPDRNLGRSEVRAGQDRRGV